MAHYIQKKSTIPTGWIKKNSKIANSFWARANGEMFIPTPTIEFLMMDHMKKKNNDV